jgi:hypothetical protein
VPVAINTTELEQEFQLETDSNSAFFDPHLLFEAEQRGQFERYMLDRNDIVEGVDIPCFITSIREKLQAIRSITTEQRV